MHKHNNMFEVIVFSKQGYHLYVSQELRIQENSTLSPIITGKPKMLFTTKLYFLILLYLIV